MPTKIEPKVADPEAEYSAAQRMYQKLAPQCSMEKRAAGIPQLAPQQKQMAILNYEMDETLLCIKLASKGQHAVRDTSIKRQIQKSIIEYEVLEAQLIDERTQQTEQDCLNYLAQKNVIDLLKTIPSEIDELAMLDNAYNRLRRMENRLDLAIKRFCIVNTDNKKTREEINRLLIERLNFNVQWKRMISKLVKGKEYLMDIFEIANGVSGGRKEWCRNLETLKWKGLFQLNKDITEMQVLDGELNHLAKLEEFLRVKGSTRICEADKIDAQKREEEKIRCEEQIARYDALLNEIFDFVGFDSVADVLKIFKRNEIWNHSVFVLLCEIMQQSIVLKNEVEDLGQKIMDGHDMNESRIDQQDKRLESLRAELAAQRKRTQIKRDLDKESQATLSKIIQGVMDLINMAKCNFTPLLSLLGNHKEATKWNVHKFLRILEVEVKSLIYVAFEAIKPTVPPPKVSKGKGPPEQPAKKLIPEPHVEILTPNRIETLVPYQPCAYCVQDYIMNLVFETPAVPADREYIEQIFHLQDVNTKFGIYTLTVPEKRHAIAYRDNA